MKYNQYYNKDTMKTSKSQINAIYGYYAKKKQMQSQSLWITTVSGVSSKCPAINVLQCFLNG